MNKLGLLLLVISFPLLFSCTPDKPEIITVTGGISINKMGKTLTHEHLLVDFIGADSISYDRWNRDEVVDKVLPYLVEIKKLNYKTLVDCTPEYLGRDPELLKILSEKSGYKSLQIRGIILPLEESTCPKMLFQSRLKKLRNIGLTKHKTALKEPVFFRAL